MAARVYTPDYVLAAVARILETLLPLFERTPGPVADTALYASYRRDIRVLLADTRAAARDVALPDTLASIAAAYRQAAADPRAVIAGLERIAVACRAIVPVEASSGTLYRQRENEQALTLTIECMALSEIGQAVAAFIPRSRDEAQSYRLRLGRAFDVTIERAAEQGATVVLRALRTAQAAMVRDLIERGRPLARLLAYETAVPMPAVVLAHRFYQDAGRTDELVAENGGTDHPGFMPMTGRAYSA